MFRHMRSRDRQLNTITRLPTFDAAPSCPSPSQIKGIPTHRNNTLQPISISGRPSVYNTIALILLARVSNMNHYPQAWGRVSV